MVAGPGRDIHSTRHQLVSDVRKQGIESVFTTKRCLIKGEFIGNRSWINHYRGENRACANQRTARGIWNGATDYTDSERQCIY